MSETEMSKIGVIGAGSWGTTLADLLAEKGMDVSLYVREQKVLDQISSEGMNRVFLPGVRLVSGYWMRKQETIFSLPSIEQLAW